MYVRACVSTDACMWVYVHGGKSVHMHAHSCLCERVHLCMCKCVRMHCAQVCCVLGLTDARAYIWACIHVRRATWVHRVHTLMRLYECVYACTHTYMNTHATVCVYACLCVYMPVSTQLRV